MAYSRMALIERGLGDKRAHTNEHVGGRCVGCRGEQASAQACGGLAAARALKRTFPVDAVAEELEEVGIRTPGARTRAVQPWAARAGPRDALRASICSTRTHPIVPVSNASRSCTLQCGERVDPAKMANSRMALTARGLSFTKSNAKSRKDGGIRLRRRARTWSRWWQPPSGCRRSGTRLTRPKRDARRQTACARSYGHRGRR